MIDVSEDGTKVYGICNPIFTEGERSAILIALHGFIYNCKDGPWWDDVNKELDAVRHKLGSDQLKRCYVEIS